MLRKILFTLIIFFCVKIIYAQISDDSLIDRKGCWIRTLVHNKYEYWEESFPIFTGEYYDSLDYLEQIELVLSPSAYDWVYIEKSQKCEPPNKVACFKLSYEFLEEDVIDLIVVSDTNKTSNYVWETYEVKELIEEQKSTEWREVPCGGASAELIKNVIWVLHEQEYISEIYDFETIEVKEAILKIQKRNGLGGSGGINIELLEYLGIK